MSCGGFIGGWSDMEILMKIERERNELLKKEELMKEEGRVKKVEMEERLKRLGKFTPNVTEKIGSKHWK